MSRTFRRTAKWIEKEARRDHQIWQDRRARFLNRLGRPFEPAPFILHRLHMDKKIEWRCSPPNWFVRSHCTAPLRGQTRTALHKVMRGDEDVLFPVRKRQADWYYW